MAQVTARAIPAQGLGLGSGQCSSWGYGVCGLGLRPRAWAIGLGRRSLWCAATQAPRPAVPYTHAPAQTSGPPWQGSGDRCCAQQPLAQPQRPARKPCKCSCAHTNIYAHAYTYTQYCTCIVQGGHKQVARGAPAHFGLIHAPGAFAQRNRPPTVRRPPSQRFQHCRRWRRQLGLQGRLLPLWPGVG